MIFTKCLDIKEDSYFTLSQYHISVTIKLQNRMAPYAGIVILGLTLNQYLSENLQIISMIIVKWKT